MNSINEIFTFLKDILNDNNDEDNSRTYEFLKKLFQYSGLPELLIQTLESTSKMIVMRLLFINERISFKMIQNWFNENAKNKSISAICELLRYGIVTGYDENGNEIKIKNIKESINLNKCINVELNKEFKNQLINCITNKCSSNWVSTKHFPKKEKSKIIKESIKNHMRQQYNRIISFLIDPSNNSVDEIVEHLLRQSKLIRNSSPNIMLTPSGYDFLFMSPEEQNWILIKNYLMLDSIKSLKYDEILLFILSMNICNQGEGYKISNLSESQNECLKDFSSFGYIFLTEKYFYPTDLGINVSLGKNSGRLNNSLLPSLSIIIETNFKIYAKTNTIESDVYSQILQLFIQKRFLFPNMISGMITRDSVFKALNKGINVKQIINFLELHLEKGSNKNEMIKIPKNVKDQLYIWESEKLCLKITPGIRVSGLTKSEYNDMKMRNKGNIVIAYDDKLELILYKK